MAREKRILELQLLNFEKIATLVILLFVLVTFSLPLIILTLPDANTQSINIRVKVRTRNGNTVMYPHVRIFHLTENGPSLIAGGPGDQNGLYNQRVLIPRIWKNKLYVNETKSNIDIYSAVNILVIAYDEGTGLVGSKAIPIDPTYMKWPFDSLTEEVVLTDELPRTLQASRGEVRVLSLPSSETWKPTQIVEYAAWSQIWVRAIFPTGSKIDIETKQRVYDPQTNQYLTGWISAGSTKITLDNDFGLPEVTGTQNNKYIGYFTFKYILCYINIPYTPYYYQTVYAADTPDKDPIENSNYWETWGGSAYGSDPFITDQNTPWRNIPITQTSQWIFTVTVSFGVSFPPPGGSIGISLGVEKEAIPYGVVQIKTGTWTQGYKAYTYGREYGFKKSYSIWKNPNG